jgi:hypothetical protein
MIYHDKEVCITAAVRARDGEVFRCHRHYDGERTILERNNPDNPFHKYANPILQKIKRVPMTDGFITSRGRFVNRAEGYKLQEAAGIPSANPTGYRELKPRLLFSEDIYWAPML